MTFYVRLKTAPPPPPEEATHFMVLKLGALPGANWDGLKSALSSIVAQAFTRVANMVGGPIGWQVVGTPVLYEPGQSTPIGTVPEGQGWVFIYLKKTGSITLGAIATVIAATLFGLGFVILAWSLHEMAQAELVTSQTRSDIVNIAKELYEEGKLSEEEFKKILDAYETYDKTKPTIYDKIAEFLGITPEQAKYLVIGFIVIFALAFIKSLFR